MRLREPSLFAGIAQWASCQAGRSWTFIAAVATVLAWAATGPLFHWSDTWQLVINTGTTIVTFLMVFLIQHAQNRDTQAIHVKLDELIRATRGAHNRLIALEDQSEEELAAAREELRRVAEVGAEAAEQAKRPCRAPFTARSSSSSFRCIARVSRFWVFWIRNTIRKVTMVVPVLITSCHVFEK